MELIRLYLKKQDGSLIVRSFFAAGTFLTTACSLERLEDLAQLYCALDVFVSASHTESFGLAIAEAMASQVAIVATETQGAKESIQPEKTGLLVPVTDSDKLAAAVLELLGNNDTRVRLGRAAQQSVAMQFSVERMIDETEEI